MAYSSSNPFAPKSEDEEEPSWPDKDEDGNPYSAFPPVLAKDLPIGGGPMPAEWGGRTSAPVRFDLLALHEADPGVVADAMRIPGRDPEALEFWGDISGYRRTGAERFTGLGRDHLGDISFPPTMPEWLAFLADHEVSADKAAAVLRTGGKDPRLMRAWAEATAKAIRSRLMCSAILAQARKYTDPDTGYGWDHLVSAKSGASLVDRAVAADKAWKDQRAGTRRGYTPPILDPTLMAEAADAEPVIGELCMTGQSLMVITADQTEATDAAEDLISARLSGGEFYGHEVSPGPVVYVDGVIPDTALARRWRDEMGGGDLVVLAHQAVPLDTREPEVRQALADSMPPDALIVVNDTTLMASADISEMTAEAGDWMAGWSRLAKDAGAAGLVIFHGSTKNNPRKGRGHATLSAWGNSRVALMDGSLRPPGRRMEAGRPEPRTSSHTRLLQMVKDDPGRSSSHYTRALGGSTNTFYRAKKRLVEAGSVVTREEGNSVVLYPSV